MSRLSRSSLSLHSLKSNLSDSTTSLFSILDHDSLDDDFSPDSEADEFIVISPVRLESTLAQQSEGEGEKFVNPSNEPSKNVNEIDYSQIDESANDCQPSTTKSPTTELSHWEKWFIQKMEKERILKRRFSLISKKQAQEAAEMEEEKKAMRLKLEQKFNAQIKLMTRREQRSASIKAAKAEEEKIKSVQNKQRALEEYRKWCSKKQMEIANKRKMEMLKESSLKQRVAQKTMLAQQAFNDWLLTKQLDLNSSNCKRGMYFTQKPSNVSLLAWRNDAESDSLPLDFSTRLFIS